MLFEAGREPRPPKGLIPVRFREVAGRVLLTGPTGTFVFVSHDEWRTLTSGADDFGPDLTAKLRARGFLREGFDVEASADRLRRKTRFLSSGPNLHILVVTRRCNETCVYCHASRATMDSADADMSPATAERAVEMALASTSPSVTIEFQGGEPLVVFDVVKHAIEHAIEKNRAAGKTLDFTLVTNLSLMDDEKLDYLISRRVQICTSIDGPAALHDKQRKLVGGSAHGAAVAWMRKINQRYVEMGLDPHVYKVEALLTTTRETLSQPRAIVDAYVELGCRALFLRPVDPFGFASRTVARVGTGREEYLAFYREAVDYMLELDKQGVEILERYAGIFLTKIMTPDDPNFLDVRSPCGAGIGQLAYDHDGRVYTCDEGRMLAASGDATFAIGDLAKSSYRDVVGHETVRALTLASNLDGQPDCVSCAYKPYCGICPVVNYAMQGSLHGRMRDSAWCATHKGIQDYLFEKLAEAEPTTMQAFDRWVTSRPRSHYVHECAPA